MSIADMPARGDINPNKNSSIYVRTLAGASYIPVIGFDKAYLYFSSYSGSNSVSFCDSNGNTISSASCNNSSWTLNQIPDNAAYLYLVSSGAGSAAHLSYSLLTKDSPYNPDNQ